MIRVFSFALLICTALQAETRTPVLVELFTSEGCSSCPPADDLLAQLASDQPVSNADLIVLSEHVDYWNTLGWKDPFSAPLFTERQQSYASSLHSNDVFTPQAVIDGGYSSVGSRRSDILKAITASAQEPKPSLEITVTRQDNALLITAANATKGEVWIAVAESNVVSHVAHGENAGRTLQHVSVVRSLTKMRSPQTKITLDRNWNANLRVIAFVQDAKSGRILQAAQKII